MTSVSEIAPAQAGHGHLFTSAAPVRRWWNPPAQLRVAASEAGPSRGMRCLGVPWVCAGTNACPHSAP